MNIPDLNKDPGLGNLNARAYMAAVIGPKRAVYGKRVVRRLSLGQAEELVRNDAPLGVEAVYVEVWLPQSQVLAGGLQVRFSASEAMGEIADLVTFGAGPQLQELYRYRVVLLPGEQLYAQPVNTAAGGPLAGPVSVIVAKVTF